MKVLLRAVLFLDAILDLLLGMLLLAAPMSSFYAALQVPQPQPALFGQLLGLALIALAWLLWQATVNGQVTVAVARTVGPLNLVSALLILAWALFLDMPLQTGGRVWLGALSAVLIFFAVVQIPAAKRVRLREKALREQEAETRKGMKTQNGAAATGGRPTTYPDYREEPVITPPPGYGPGTEVVTEPVPEATPSAHHARQNPHS